MAQNTAKAVFAAGRGAMGYTMTSPPPKRLPTGEFSFADAPTFRPNLSPAEVLRAGSFGGGYFRDIKSGVTGEAYKDVWRELPKEWLDGVDIAALVASPTHSKAANKYKVDCGVKEGKKDQFGLRAWESSGWIMPQDPYGWFQWYCRFMLGRRSDDDERQITRWERCAGPRGRWRSNLIAKVMRDGKTFDDPSVSPVVRQTLQHWGYQLTEEHFELGTARVRKNGASYVPREQLAGIIEPDKKKKKKR